MGSRFPVPDCPVHLLDPLYLQRRLLLLLLLLLAALILEGSAAAQPRPKVSAATAAVLSPDATLVAAQTDWKMRVWQRSSGQLITWFDNQPSFFRGAIAAGALVGIAGEKLAAWRGPRLQQRVTPRAQPPVTTFGRVFVSPDGLLLGAIYPRDGGAGDPDSLGVWDVRSGEPRGALSWSRGQRVHGLVFGPRGRLAAFGDEPGRRGLLRLYQLGPGRRLQQRLAWSSSTLQATFSAAISSDGKRLALGAGERILLWDLDRLVLLGEVPTGAARQLFPQRLQIPAVQIPGAHQLAFRHDGRRLAVLHGFGVTGVALWELTPGSQAVMKPVAWLKRPPPGQGGSLRQMAWDRAGQLWLITASYGPTVFVHRARLDDFVLERSLQP